MSPGDYDAWYESARGRWIGETEFRLLGRLLDIRPGHSVLDVGCGTGWFTRRFAAMADVRVTGLDRDVESLMFAHDHDRRSSYVLADASSLPFVDASFDRIVSIAALCFMPNWRIALSEMIRVTRGRFAVGTLHRPSFLWWMKARGGGTGAYRGAHWHTGAEFRRGFDGLPVSDLRLHYGIFVPTGSRFAQTAERAIPSPIPFGAVVVATGYKMVVIAYR